MLIKQFFHTNQLNGLIRLVIQRTSHMDHIYETSMVLLHFYVSYISFFVCSMEESHACLEWHDGE